MLQFLSLTKQFSVQISIVHDNISLQKCWMQDNIIKNGWNESKLGDNICKLIQ